MSIRIVGCGSMGSAIAQSLAEGGKDVILFDKHLERAEGLARAIPAQVCQEPLENSSPEEVLFLAFKPQDFHASLPHLQNFEGKFVASILTGISIEELKSAFPNQPVLRMMPNLAVRYGDGIVALGEDPDLRPLKEEIEEIFSPLGLLRWIPEEKFDGITSLIGSGPAFVFAIVEAMVDASISMGFTAQEGYELLKQMIGGSLTLLYESNDIPTELKWRVTSPGGTTIAGLRTFEEKGVRSGIIETFLSAYKKAQEMGQQN